MQKLRILHIAPLVGKNSFGIGQISVNLARAQYALGHNVKIWCFDSRDNIRWASETHDFPSEYITGFKLSWPHYFWFSREMSSHARNIPEDTFDIVHQHGIWTGGSNATLIFARSKNVPTVIAPHGSLNQWALNLSRWKKKIALTTYEQRNLSLASCLHATSENEIDDFRKFGLKNPIAYIENGIQEKNLYVRGDGDRFRTQNAIPADKRILLFLSRISPKKGLMMLVEAIYSIKDDFSGWLLVIAGIDEFNHKKDIEVLIKQLNLGEQIRIIGPLFDQFKYDAFAAAELFILPSYSEGSPMVVLDSLVAGVPVITTKASTWRDLEDYNCGWWTEISTKAITIALKEAVEMSSEDLLLMGEQGKKLIEIKYIWPRLADKTIRLYDWLLGRNEKPDFVHND